MTIASILLVGGGWRGQSFARVMAALPERFRLTGIVTRQAARADELQRSFGVPCGTDLATRLRADPPSFVVAAVPWAVTPLLVGELAAQGRDATPLLIETPPAPTLEAMQQLARLDRGGLSVQVAEQYPSQPSHAARLAFAASGRLGSISFASVSVAHGYHGVALLRRALGVGFALPRITARSFSAPIAAGPDRGGPPLEDRTESAQQLLAWLDFGDRLGVFDFAGPQYFSWIRGRRLHLRGDRGEIDNDDARWLTDYRTPMTARLERVQTGADGNLEGYALRGITAAGQWWYTNPFFPARLSDDELAMAHLLARMASHAEGGPPVYSLADACQDHYLGLAIETAAATGGVLLTEPQPWMQAGQG